VTVVCLFAFSVAIAADTSPPYRVQWPSGWEVTRLPAPTSANGKNLGGERVRAVSLENGRPAAAIELTSIPRRDGGKADLEYEFNSMLKFVREGYESKGLTVSVGARKTASLGTLEALEAEISATGPSVVLRQWVSMALSKEYMYSLSFTGPSANFARYRDTFQQTLRSLVLK
jgi:Domain of unknown function (DUF4946)